MKPVGISHRLVDNPLLLVCLTLGFFRLPETPRERQFRCLSDEQQVITSKRRGVLVFFAFTVGASDRDAEPRPVLLRFVLPDGSSNTVAYCESLSIGQEITVVSI